MTRGGHYATALALALAGAALLPHGLVPHGLAFALGAAAGADAPDYLELPQFDALGRRRSLIAHRSWTHYWPFWATLAAFAVISMPWAAGSALVAFGYALAGLLHLSMDILTPMGIPLRWPPVGRRTSLRVYKTGSLREVAIIGLVWGAAAVLVLVASAVMWLFAWL